MVGHTHEDIDQFFSKFSQYLQHNSAHTLPGNKVMSLIAAITIFYPDFLSAITSCYADVSSAVLLDTMYDVKSWLTPHLDMLQYHSYPHVFRFTCNALGEVVMFYKQWSKSPWEPTSGIKLFKVNFTML